MMKELFFIISFLVGGIINFAISQNDKNIYSKYNHRLVHLENIQQNTDSLKVLFADDSSKYIMRKIKNNELKYQKLTLKNKAIYPQVLKLDQFNDSLIDVAANYYISGNYTNALVVYNALLKKNSPKVHWIGRRGKDYLLQKISECHAFIGNYDSSFYFMNYAIDQGLKDYSIFAYYPCFNKMESDKRWFLMKNKMIKSINISNICYDIQLCSTIRELESEDNYSRQRYLYYVNCTSPDKKIIDSLWIIVKETDSLNYFFLKGLLGRINISNNLPVGLEEKTLLTIMVIHSTESIQLSFLPYLYRWLKNDDPYVIHMLIDRILVKKGEMQLYGTQYKNNTIAPIRPSNEESDVLRRLGLTEM
jgi:hypothetical protein